MKKVYKIYEFAGGVFITLAMCVIVGNVLLRSIFNVPIKGSYELTGLCTLLFGAAAIVMGLISGTAISVDVMVGRLRGKAKIVFDYIGHLANVVLFTLYTWGGWKAVVQMSMLHEKSDTWKIPLVPLRALWMICAGVVVVSEIVVICKLHKKYLPGAQDDSGKTAEEGGA